MKAIPHWVTYTVLRLLLFVVPLVILLVLQLPWWLAAIIAAVVGLCLSYLLLGSSRHAVARDIAAVRSRKRVPATADDEVEDAFVEAIEHEAAEREAAEHAAADHGAAEPHTDSMPAESGETARSQAPTPSEAQSQSEKPAASEDEGSPEEQPKDKAGDPGQFQR